MEFFQSSNKDDIKKCENSKDGGTVIEGMFKSCKIIQDRYPFLEHGDLKAVHYIVLHQTNGKYAGSTLARYWGENFIVEHKDNFMIADKLANYAKQGIGAHFLISPDGTIRQTARVDKICYHVGYIRARCMETHVCEKNETQLYDSLHKKDGMHVDSENADDKADVETWKKLSTIESKKEWDKRYPTNQDAIAIEVVGKPEKGIYQAPTTSQNASSTWLVKLLLTHFNLKTTNVFSHGKIGSQKAPSEGINVKF